MKIVLATYGSRGDVEPCAAVARELQGRGHDVRIALSPDQLGLAESAGLRAVAYGPDSREQINTATDFVHTVQNPLEVTRCPHPTLSTLPAFLARPWPKPHLI